MPTASAPGKVYLFGEHAVVYGEPAVPCAIERRATVDVEPRNDGRTRLHAPALELAGLTFELGDDCARVVETEDDYVQRAVQYVVAALDEARESAGTTDVGFDVRVHSDLPIGAGLGSSAAVVVATVDAATRALGDPLPREAIAEAGYRVERAVQGGASRADTFCSAMGGAVRVEGDDCRRLDAPPLEFVVGNDGDAGETGPLVATVRARREQYGFVRAIVEAIGELVRAGEDALAEGDLEELGRLMDVNHGLLSSLGVSSPSLDAMVWAARRGGAHGAKLTGAGGGGCIVGLDPGGGAELALALTPECEEAYSTALSTEGVVRE